MGFIGENFLLQSDVAEQLYHNYAKDLPLIDYHSHLPPDVIASNANFRNISHIWLAGDHYKWRAMRALGIAEKYITGDASDREKFLKWAEVIPYTLRNPLYHWSHMELKDPFGIDELLSPQNAEAIYDQTEKQLQTPAFSPQGLLNHFNVELVGTTDDPTDSLVHHTQIAKTDLKTKIRPSFRPDKIFKLAGGDNFRAYVAQLATASGQDISDLDSLLVALQSRIDYFHTVGCRISDHGLNFIPVATLGKNVLEKVFKEVLDGNDSNAYHTEGSFTFYVLLALCSMYHAKGWVQQFHLGALRNNNVRMLDKLGADTGYDSIGDYTQGESLSALLNQLEQRESLTKTIIYNVNPAYNAVFAAMTGNFQEEGIKGKIQYGSAWWFMDQLDGMTDQINMLSNIGLLSCFVGMLTDSRSFLSYPRHDYFRRLLSNLLAEDVKKGYLPADIPWIGKIVSDICYFNAKNYFTY
ncbi:D-glucuronate isomerase [bacterium A37T11]|nr:D-glucuronate isomerase [bacterium A37T11]